MINFTKVCDFIVDGIIDEVIDNDDLINKDSFRALFTGVDDCIFRGPDCEGRDINDLAWMHNEIDCVDYEIQVEFPLCMELALDILNFTRSSVMGRVFITRLRPGDVIESHVDEGDSGEYYNRCHAVIQGGSGNTFTSGDESLDMESGSIWFINNHIEHSVVNNMDQDRIHLIIDMK